MKHRTLTVLVWTVVLITLMSGLNLTQVSGSTTSSGADATVTQTSQELSCPIGNGSINYHLATEADIQLIRAQLTGNGNSLTANGTSSNITHATGLSTPTDDQLQSLVGNIMIFDSYSMTSLGSSPTMYDISNQSYFPEVRDQGSEGSCAAFSTIYYNYGYLVAKDNGWSDACLGNDEHLMSPGWAYNKVVLKGHGSIIEDNALVGKTIGICTWNNLPYVASDYLDMGSEAAWRDAASHQIDNIIYYTYNGDSTIQAIKDSLVSNHPVTIALNGDSINGAHPAAFTDDYVLSSSEYAEYNTTITNHAVTIVGYNDSITDNGDVGAFKVVNSWGTSFGDNGYFWMTYKTIEMIGNLLQAISLTDKVDYSPSYLAVYHFNYPITNDVSAITFSAVRNSDNTVVDYISPHFAAGILAYMPTFMCQDISSLSAYIMDTHYRIELSVGSSYYKGNISSFRIEVCNDPYIAGRAIAIGPEATGLPMNTPCNVSTQLPNESIVSSSEALSYFDGALTFSGDAQWVGVRDVQGRKDVMQSGDVGDGCNSTLIDVIQGPGTISFDWKVSSEFGYDYLSVSLNGSLIKQITGETPWTTVTISVPAGTYYLNWTYSKDEGKSSGNDCGWIDNVTWDGRSSVFFEDFEPSGTNSWYNGDNNPSAGVDCWNASTLNPYTGTDSLWCAENGIGTNGLPNNMNGYYDQNMNSSIQVVLPDLTGISNAMLSFEYWAFTNYPDHAFVQTYNGSTWTTIWNQPEANSEGWKLAEVAMPLGAQDLRICFTSDSGVDVGYPGVFIDDLLITVLDTQAPSSWLSPLSTYTTTQGVNLTCTANDVGGSGVAYVQVFYRKGTTGSFSAYVTNANPSGQWAPGTIHVDLTALGLGDGLYQFYTVATDRAGNVETKSTADKSTTWDRSAPTTTASNTGTASPGWNDGPVTVTLSANDATSGVSATWYRIDTGVWTSYTAAFTISTQGIHSVQYYSVDNAGNVESMKTLTVKIDEQSPVSSVTLTGTAGNAPWYVSNVSVNITASDMSGISKIEYRLDGVNWLTYDGNVSIAVQGNYTLDYAATDLAGNREATRSITIKIDKEAPVTTCVLTGSGNTVQNFFNGTVSINLTTNDPVSGVSSVRYSLDSGLWTDYSGMIMVGTEGDHKLMYRSADLAGNVEQRTVNFTVDVTPPTSNVTLIGSEGIGWYVSNVTIQIVASDPGSGVKSTVYRLDDPDGAWITYSGDLTVTSEGAHELQYRSIDMAGNYELVQSKTFAIDRTMPISEVALSGNRGLNGWYVGPVSATFTANDSLSGVQTIHYRLDGGVWAAVTSFITISADGNHSLEYYSVDNAGNAEAIRSVRVKIDTVAPTGNFSLENGVTVSRQSFNVSVTANDGGSGVTTMLYKLDDWAYTPCTGDQIDLSDLSEGPHKLSLEIIDQAGNTAVKELNFTVDTSAKGTNVLTDGLVIVAVVIIAMAAIVAVVLRRRARR